MDASKSSISDFYRDHGRKVDVPGEVPTLGMEALAGCGDLESVAPALVKEMRQSKWSDIVPKTDGWTDQTDS